MTVVGAVKAAGVLGAGAGGVAAAVLSPLPLLVLGGVALLVFGPVAVVVLTAALSCHPVRQANAAAVMDRLIAVVCWNRWRPTTANAPQSGPEAPTSASAPTSRSRHRSPAAPTT
ncbi:MAG: hypothetical protein M3R63_22140 [Actinomycetota bacterium]|nr:hypothetical protein [Actinomycetota bacterium]